MRAIGFALLIVLLNGCVEKRLTINSDPPGALVYLNGQEVGRTPMTRQFEMYGDYDLQLRKEGYQTLKGHAAVRAPIWQWIPLDLLSAVLPFRFEDHQRFSYALKTALTTQAVDAAGLMERATALRGQLASGRTSAKSQHAPATQATTRP
jgi:hypothetical protein